MVQAQIAGLAAGASPQAYAEVFAELAARRALLQDRHGVLAQSLARAMGASQPGRGKKKADLKPAILADVYEALTSEYLEGVEKRNLIGRVVDRVICHKDGAEVVFSSGVFGADITDTLQSIFTVSSKRVGQRSIRPRRKASRGASAGCVRQ